MHPHPDGFRKLERGRYSLFPTRHKGRDTPSLARTEVSPTSVVAALKRSSYAGSTASSAMRTYVPCVSSARTRPHTDNVSTDAPMIRNRLNLMSAPFLEHFFCHGQRRENVRPTRVEGELREDFGGFRLRQSVIHRPVEVVGHLRDLTRRHQGADR